MEPSSPICRRLTELLYSGMPEDEIVRGATLMIRSVLTAVDERVLRNSGVNPAFFDVTSNRTPPPEPVAKQSVPIPGVSNPEAFLAGKKLGEVISDALRRRIDPVRCEVMIDAILSSFSE